ncbi:hypothetical protein O3P69_020609 [Scylla paramamosain]|uniref:Uncharacterized protein n=1 Tax=Scylla paramamosain TaxID=85552 RepID=A0AAW0TLY5_SCYPA
MLQRTPKCNVTVSLMGHYCTKGGEVLWWCGGVVVSRVYCPKPASHANEHFPRRPDLRGPRRPFNAVTSRASREPRWLQHRRGAAGLCMEIGERLKLPLTLTTSALHVQQVNSTRLGFDERNSDMWLMRVRARGGACVGRGAERGSVWRVIIYVWWRDGEEDGRGNMGGGGREAVSCTGSSLSFLLPAVRSGSHKGPPHRDTTPARHTASPQPFETQRRHKRSYYTTIKATPTHPRSDMFGCMTAAQGVGREGRRRMWRRGRESTGTKEGEGKGMGA